MSTASKVKLTVCSRVRPVITEDYKHATTRRNAPEICVHCSQDGQTLKVIQDHLHFKEFAVDHAFDSSASQTDVYKTALRPIVKEVLQGYNGTCMVYGQTTSGKTFTMFGSENKLGITHLAVNDIFEAAKQYEELDLIAKVYISFYQIYIENVYDLLVDNPAGQKQPTSLNIRQEGEASFQAEGLRYVYVKDRDQAFQVISQGLQRRVVHSTAYNIRSSRSHAILQIHLDFEEHDEEVANAEHRLSSKPQQQYGTLLEKRYVIRRRTLTLVDLAGSERVVSYRQTAKQQLLEAGMINKSLAALGNCIYALGNREHSGDPTAHVPYRDCKLTRLLAESLGGNAKTCIITTVSPCFYNMEETISTLKFAARAKSVRKMVKKPRVQEFTTQSELLPYFQHFEHEEEAYGDIYEEGMAAEEGKFYAAPSHSLDEHQYHHQTASNDPYAQQGFPNAQHRHPSQPMTRLHHTPMHTASYQHQYPMQQPVPHMMNPSMMAPSPVKFEKPNQTFSLRDFLQACSLVNKTFDPESTENFDLPPPPEPSPLPLPSAEESTSLSSRNSSRPPTPKSNNNTYSSHPSKIESAVEAIPGEIEAIQRALSRNNSGSKVYHLDTSQAMSESSQLDEPFPFLQDSPSRMSSPPRMNSPSRSRSGRLTTENLILSPSKGNGVSEFQFQTESTMLNYVIKCHKGVQTWSMTPTVSEGKSFFDGTLDDFSSVKPPSKIDQMTEIDEETLMYTTNSIQDPSQRNELLKLAKLSPMELVTTLVELRSVVFQLTDAVKQRDEQIRLLQELVLDVTTQHQLDANLGIISKSHALSYDNVLSSTSFEDISSRLQSFDLR